MNVRRLRERLAFRIAPWVYPLYREAVMRERERLLRAHMDAHRARLAQEARGER